MEYFRNIQEDEMQLIEPGNLAMLRRFGNFMSALFGAPVYLVGSALREGNTDPRDWDLRLCLSDVDFVLRYQTGDGLVPKGTRSVIEAWASQRRSGNFERLYWRWADEMVRYSNVGRRQTLLNIDLQVYPASYWAEYEGRPRLRLDTREEG
jgi:hypothetical protein